MKKVLAVIDMQNDFITGPLGSKGAQDIVPVVRKKIEEFEGDILVTMDTHDEDYLETMEGKNLPVKHCVANTDGWEIEPSLKLLLIEKGAAAFCKSTFGSTRLLNALKAINPSSIELCGLVSSICVISNALLIKTYFPEAEIVVDKNCTAGVTEEDNNAALKVMEMCQIKLI